MAEIANLTAELIQQRKRFYRDLDGVLSCAKDADSSDLFYIDWSDKVVSGESLSTSSWELSGVTGSSELFAGTTTGITITGSDGEAKNTVTTGAGRTLVRRLRFVGAAV